MHTLIGLKVLLVVFAIAASESVRAQIPVSEGRLDARAAPVGGDRPLSIADGTQAGGSDTTPPDLEGEKPILMSPTTIQGRRHDPTPRRFINMIPSPPLEELGGTLSKLKGRKRFIWESTSRGFRYRFLWRER